MTPAPALGPVFYAITTPAPAPAKIVKLRLRLLLRLLITSGMRTIEGDTMRNFTLRLYNEEGYE